MRKTICFFVLAVILMPIANAQYAEEAKLRQRYDKVVRLTDAEQLLFYVYSAGKKGVCNGAGDVLIPCGKYNDIDYILPQKNGRKYLFFRVFRDGMQGRCSPTGREIVPPIATKIISESDEDPEIRFYAKIGQWETLYDTAGVAVVSSGRYNEVLGYNPNLSGYRVRRGNKEGLVDYSGKELVAPQYDEVVPLPPFKLLRIAQAGKMGICDYSGKVIINPQRYTRLVVQLGKYIEVIIGNSYGVCDSTGREIIPPIYRKIVYSDVTNTYIVTGEESMGVFKSDGTVLFSPQKYLAIKHFPGAKRYVAWVTKDSVGIFDENGRAVIAPAMERVGIIGDTVIIAIKNKKAGLFDINGRVIVPLKKYMVLGVENYGFIRVADENNLMGLCDYRGTEIISPRYNAISPPVITDTKEIIFLFRESNDKWGLINCKGNIIANPIYDAFHAVGEGLVGAKKNGHWGYVAIETGREETPFEYDSVTSFSAGTAIVYKNGKMSQITNPLSAARQTTAQIHVKDKAVSTFPAANSEVDKNIPNGKKADAHTYAFIIANENYPAAKVPYALNDGWTFEKYCKQSLGIPSENVHLFEDATGGNIAACVEQMKQAATSANGNATIIFYYAGHAFPDEDSKSGYLLPIDGDSKNTATGYSLEKLYKELNSINAKQIVCFIDACFSGTTRDDQMLIAGRGVAIKVKDEIPQGNMVVMTSATGAETAHSYEEMHHGLFTYFLLEKLQQTGGDVTLGELSEHVTKMVKRKSVLINQKKQTPTVIPSPQQQGTWQSIKL